MNNSSKLVQGIGVKGTTYPTWDGKKMLKEYDIWKAMLLRCANTYCIKYPTYKEVSCSENFKSYTFFYEWCNKQIGFKNLDEKGKYWQLDKDLLLKGNKLYGEDTCVFLPHKINTLIIKNDARRGEYPIGVSKHKHDGIYSSTCNLGKDVQKRLGIFSCPMKAFSVYKAAKESYIKQVAEQYKDVIDPRAYKALLEYEVNIDD